MTETSASLPSRAERLPSPSTTLVDGIIGLHHQRSPRSPRGPYSETQLQPVSAPAAIPSSHATAKNHEMSRALTSRMYSEVSQRIQEVSYRQALRDAQLSARRRTLDMNKSPRTEYRQGNEDVMTSLGYQKMTDPVERSGSVVWRKKQYVTDRARSTSSSSRFLYP
jgi:hypothetical protein